MDSWDVLRLTELNKSYKKFAIQDISLEIKAGEILGLVGENGAGKTTIINCILGLIRAESGSIKLFGEEVSKGNPAYVGDGRFASLRQAVGVVFDTCAFPDEFTVAKIGNFGSLAFDQWDKARFDALTKEFSLDSTKSVGKLSRGMGMKLSLIFALAHHPSLLVLDEATAGLDPMARSEMLELIRQQVAENECGVLMASHITSDLERTADTLVCIHDGKILVKKPMADIIEFAGIARCHDENLATLKQSGVYGPGKLRYLKGAYATDVLVPDRFAFAEAFPEIPVDSLTLDEYLAFLLKGDVLC